MYTLGIMVSTVFGFFIGKWLYQPLKDSEDNSEATNEPKKPATSGPLDIKVGDYFAFIFRIRDEQDARIVLDNRAIVKLYNVRQSNNDEYSYCFEYKNTIYSFTGPKHLTYNSDTQWQPLTDEEKVELL